MESVIHYFQDSKSLTINQFNLSLLNKNINALKKKKKKEHWPQTFELCISVHIYLYVKNRSRFISI